MGIMHELEIESGNSKEEILKNLFMQKKKWISRQNAADLSKRLEAEKIVSLIDQIQGIVNVIPNSFDTSLVLESYAFAFDSDKLVPEYVEALKRASNGNVKDAADIAVFLKKNSIKPLYWRWVKSIENSGSPDAFGWLGNAYSETNTDWSYEWYKKGYDAKTLSPIYVYEYGFLLFKMGQLDQALELMYEAQSKGVTGIAETIRNIEFERQQKAGKKSNSQNAVHNFLHDNNQNYIVKGQPVLVYKGNQNVDKNKSTFKDYLKSILG